MSETENLSYASPYMTYGDVLSRMDDYNIAILPWGSIEPHGLHLSYITDGLLASMISILSVEKTGELKQKFFILPCFNLGSQNIGQTNKKMCIHFNGETQYCVLMDIVSSLYSQGLKKLVIINGHNGNTFKTVVRDIENNYNDFKIFVCNYLDIVHSDKKEEPLNSIPFPEIDDHAGFTETSLMMHFMPEVVKLEYNKVPYEEKKHEEIKGMWSPRDWDEVSHYTCVGDPSTASAEFGKKISDYVTDVIGKSLIQIYKMGD